MSAVLKTEIQQEWTAELFFNSPLSQDHELVNGKLVKIMPAGFIHGVVAHRIGRVIGNFVDENGLGEVVAAETGFILFEKTFRGADLAFISNVKLAQFGYPEGFFPAAPDLAVEVASPGNSVEELQTKVEEYLKAGSRLVWVIYPKTKVALVYRSNNVVSLLREADELDGEDVLPNFRLSIARLFGNLPQTEE